MSEQKRDVAWSLVAGLAILQAAIVFTYSIYNFYQPKILTLLGAVSLVSVLPIFQSGLGVILEPLIQSEVQPSPLRALPSSHSSMTPLLTRPSPQNSLVHESSNLPEPEEGLRGRLGVLFLLGVGVGLGEVGLIGLYSAMTQEAPASLIEFTSPGLAELMSGRNRGST